SNPNLTKGGIKFVAKSGRKNSHVKYCLYAPLTGGRIFAWLLASFLDNDQHFLIAYLDNFNQKKLHC
ncbi:hypothetical protein, partial [Gilliamella sp. B3812]|uniref:hypothetical protein n=1 Tax=Gilliamella sp. B3812 TaxID=2817999 RepID=UPI00226A4D34